MKKLKFVIFFIISIVFFFGGCVLTPEMQPIRKIPRSETIAGVDFTKYSENGFLFTPVEYSGQYESIGILRFTISAEANLKQSIDDTSLNAAIANNFDLSGYLNWEVEEIDYSEVLDLAYEIATNMNGDAIMNFRFNLEMFNMPNIPNYPDVDIPVITVSGFIIKRQD